MPVTYINFDLPENLIVSSYYLKASNPEKRIKIFDGSEVDLSREDIQQYDAVLMPNYFLPKLEALSVDLFINTVSLSEMDFVSIEAYCKQISRVTRRYFYHENIIDSGASFYVFPTQTFPKLNAFIRLHPSGLHSV